MENSINIAAPNNDSARLARFRIVEKWPRSRTECRDAKNASQSHSDGRLPLRCLPGRIPTERKGASAPVFGYGTVAMPVISHSYWTGVPPVTPHSGTGVLLVCLRSDHHKRAKRLFNFRSGFLRSVFRRFRVQLSTLRSQPSTSFTVSGLRTMD